MPFVTEESSVLDAVGFVPESGEAPELEFFRDVLPAGFRRESTIGETFIPPRLRARPINVDVGDSEPVPGFNPLDELDDRYAPFANAFIHARNPAEKRFIESRIDRELEDRQIIDAAGFRGFVASMAGGLIDPLILLPVGGVTTRILAKGGGLLKGGAATGFAGFLGSSASELVLQAEQETRSFGESALNITGASILSGALGIGVSALSNQQAAQLLDDTEAILGGESRIAGGMDIRDAKITPEDVASDVADGSEIVVGKLKSALGSDKLLSRFLSSPLTRILVRSRSNSARKALLDLADTPVFLEENALGRSAGPSVESLTRIHTAGLGESVEAMDRLFVQMKTGKPGGRLKRTMIQVQDRVGRRNLNDVRDMTRDEFKTEISRTMRRGDKHPIPEVQEAADVWRAKVFDPLKDRAIEAKLLPEDVTVETALSYLTRVYNRPKIEALRGTTSGLEVQSRGWLAARHPDLTEDQVADIAEQITDRILGLEGGRILVEPVRLSGASPLKQRTFLIPDQRIENFLENDIELIGRSYLRTMAADVELQSRFGSLDMAKEIEGIKSDYLELINKAKTNKERTKLARRRDQDIEDVAAMRDLLRGTYARAGNPDSSFVRINRGIRQFNMVRVGGGFMVSSLPDAGSITMAHGIRRVIGDGVVPMIRNFKGFKAGAAETKLAGTAWDMVLDTRALSFADLGDEFGRHSRFERGLESLTRTFTLVNGLSPWNAAMKQFTGVVTQARILDAVTALKAGKIKPRELEKLAQSGISRDDALLIAELFERHGSTDRGVRLANTVEWAGDARYTFEPLDVAQSVEGKVFYHGTKSNISNLESAEPGVFSDATAMFGEGLYLTDNPAVANSYALNKGLSADGAPGRVFEATLKDVKLIDLEARFPDDVQDIFDSIELSGERFGDLVERGTTGREVFEALKREFVDNDFTLHDASEVYAEISDGLVQAGYQGFRHEGGKTIGQEFGPHNVAILFDNFNATNPSRRLEGSLTDVGSRSADSISGEEAVRLRNVFRAAVAKDVDTIIVTPGIADKPLWMSTQTGRTIGQFKSFAMSATQRVMLLRLQQRDAAVLNGLLLSTGLGMMVYAQKTLQSGRPLSDDPRVWIREGVDRSGVTGFIFDINNISEKLTRNTIGINTLIGGPTASRYASRNVSGALAGPTLGLIETAARVTGAAATQDVNQGDVRAIRRMVPYQNLFYLDKLFDAAEEGVNREFRIPRTARR